MGAGEHAVTRFRLRFLLHEIDLRGPQVLLGRGADCHVTLEDPLVSREHACIRIEEDAAYLRDLNSRNGVQVNGRPVRGEVQLEDGDRIRLGTQELVFSRLTEQQRAARATGCIVMCGVCRTPYPEEANQCPHCGATRRDEEETMSGLVVEQDGGWTAHLMLEGIGRALDAERAVDADRMMQRLAVYLEREMGAERIPEPKTVSLVACAALSLLRVSEDLEWLDWMLNLHVRCDLFPSEEVVAELEQLHAQRPEVAETVDGFLTWWENRAGELRVGDAERWARLKRLSA